MIGFFLQIAYLIAAHFTAIFCRITTVSTDSNVSHIIFFVFATQIIFICLNFFLILLIYVCVCFKRRKLCKIKLFSYVVKVY